MFGNGDKMSPQQIHLRELAGVGFVLALAGFGFWAGGWGMMAACILLFSIGMAVPPVAGFAPSPWYVVGLAGMCAALVSWAKRRGFRGSRRHAPCVNWRAIAAGILVFVLLLGTTLTHTFTSPCGLGVFGGKAKLFFLAGGIPEGFFTANCWETLQPAYPPGWALVTLGAYGIAGCCGEYWTQLLGCAALAGLVVFMCAHAGGWMPALWVAATFLTATNFQLGSYYYAEPVMALFVLAGWERARKNGDDWQGWILLGAAGWFKNEGILVLPACWLAMRLIGGKSSAPIKWLLAGLVLPAAWHFGCRIAGGGLYDFAPVWQPDWRQAGLALERVTRLAFARPWRYGFVWPLAGLATVWWWLRGCRHIPRTFTTTVFAAVLMTVAYACIFSLSRAVDFDWHLDSMERLLWFPSLLLARETLDFVRADLTTTCCCCKMSECTKS